MLLSNMFTAGLQQTRWKQTTSLCEGREVRRRGMWDWKGGGTSVLSWNKRGFPRETPIIHFLSPSLSLNRKHMSLYRRPEAADVHGSIPRHHVQTVHRNRGNGSHAKLTS